MLIKDTNSFLSLWARAFSVVFGQAAVTPPTFTLVEKPASTGNNPVRVVIGLSGVIDGSLMLEVDQSAISAMAANFLGEAVQPYNSEHTETFLEIVRQCGAVVADEVRPDYGEIGVEVATVDSNERTDCDNVAMIESLIMDVPVSMSLHIQTTLNQSLCGLSSGSSAKDKPIDSDQSEQKQPSVDSDPNLNLIMDLELKVMINFGKRIMPLSEVLALGSGSVIELDHQVDEPVELLLQDKVIARGEVVIVDGNYGLRVTECPATPGPVGQVQ